MGVTASDGDWVTANGSDGEPEMGGAGSFCHRFATRS
jgi:hypothetical protein